MDEPKLWLWRNGPYEFWAFDNPYPCHPNGDPKTLGEPVGYALVKPSINGRPEVSDDEVMKHVRRAK